MTIGVIKLYKVRKMKLAGMLAVTLLFIITNCYADEGVGWAYETMPSEVKANLPFEVAAYMRARKEGKLFTVDDSINPMYLRSDIDGDGKQEYVVLIKNYEDDSRGILVYYNPEKTDILFAGVSRVKTVSGLYKNSSSKETHMETLPQSLDRWSVYLGEVVVPATTNPMSDRKGEMIMFGKIESWMVMLYWNGNEYVLYNLGG